MDKIKQLETKANEMIALMEEMYPKARLLGDSPLKDLYLDLRKTAYNLSHAPEAFLPK